MDSYLFILLVPIYFIITFTIFYFTIYFIDTYSFCSMMVLTQCMERIELQMVLLYLNS